MRFLPFSVPDIGQDEIDEVVHTLRSGWLTTGPKTARFENDFRTAVRSSHALAVNSCTAGLHLALLATGLEPGDEVITTSLTFCATVNSIIHAGGKPVLADIGPDLNIDPQSIRSCITPKTRAVIPVHFAGLPCRMDDIWAIAREHNLAVIEDAAHAAGAFYRGQPIGSGPSAAVAFSFYATKNLTTGEGGMITTNSEYLYQRMKVLALHGISRDAWNRYSEEGNWFYEVTDCGWKYNLTDIASAIGIHQLRRLSEMTRRRREIAGMYNRAFSEMPELDIPPDRGDSVHCWHLYVLRLRLKRLAIDRSEFISALREHGIGCSVHFIPIGLHPYFQGIVGGLERTPGVAEVWPRIVSLPLYSTMSDSDVERVIETVEHVIARCSRKATAVAGAGATGG
jgi:dTDP-4-amino-4,6-dideoxygalactose transaminase